MKREETLEQYERSFKALSEQLAAEPWFKRGLHILHHPKIPNTKLKRAVISRPFVDEVESIAGRWKGYRLRAGKYGMQPFVLSLSISDGTRVPVLFREFTRLCENLRKLA